MNNFIQRTLTGIIYVAVLVVGAIYQTPFLLIFPLLMSISLYEFYTILLGKQHLAKWLSGIIISLALFYGMVLFSDLSALTVPALLLMWFIAAIYLLVLLFSTRSLFQNQLSTILLGIMYIGIPFALLPTLSNLGEQHWMWLLTLMVIIWLYDSFAYIFGVSFGKHRLYQKISPKKSWEGAFGGTFVTLLVAYFTNKFAGIGGMEPMWFVIFTFIIIIAATLGDLIESMFKRKKGVKDSGSLLPGHGGFFDRLDSFIFSVPFLVILLILFNFFNK